MIKIKLKNIPIYITLFLFILNISLWVANIYHLTTCDFKAPYKCEIIHGVGVVTPTYWITGWSKWYD